MISILAFLAIGALAGWIAGKIMKTEGSLGFRIVLGIVGGIVGGWIGNLLGWSNGGMLQLNLSSILSAVVGACVVLIVARWLGKHGK